MKVIALLLITFGLSQGYVTFSRLAQSLSEENTKMCQGPNGEGLESSLAGMDELIPLYELVPIFLNALTTDEEVQNVMIYLTSPESFTLINKFFKSVEVGKVINFACRELYFDAIYHANQIGPLFGFPQFERNSMHTPKNVINLRKGGVPGLIANILRVIDVENLKVFIQDKINNDKYVQLIYKSIHSPEGRENLENMMENDDLDELLVHIAKLISDVPGVLVELRKLFGWLELLFL